MNPTSTCRSRIRRTLLASALVVATGAASAAVVTTPAGVVNGPFSDAPAFGVWQRIDIRATASVGSNAVLPSPRCSRIAPLSKIDRSPSVSHGTWPNGWCAKWSAPRTWNGTLATQYGNPASSSAQRTRKSRT